MEEKKYYELTKTQKIYYKAKSLCDRVAGVLGLVVASPVFLAIGVMIKKEEGLKAPLFFKQKRVGKDQQLFELYKFRSMSLQTPHDTPTHLLSDPEKYITKTGKFLRHYSLDELPQFINIIKGEMAVCGPRPALWNQDDLNAEREAYGVHQIKPGLTGWAQIHGRDELEIPEKAKLDAYYLKHFGLWIDIKCFFGTIFSVIKGDGVVEGGTGALHEEAEKKEKILIITNHSYMFWQFRRELTEELLRTYEVVLSTPFVGHEEDLKAMGVRCINTEVDRRGINPKTDWKLMKTYYELLKAEKPDKVITYSIKPNIYAGLCCAAQNIPYYANVQGLGTAFQKPILAAFVTILYKTAFKKVETVFFENEVNAEEFRKRHILSAEKQTVLHGAGINLEHYQYQPYPANETVHFLYLGRIMKEKGMDELFEVCERLHKEEENFVLDLVGFFEDEYKETVERLEAEGIVKYHGFQENPRPFYAAADCIVMPSYHEGMSNVNLEAAATGRPVITTNIPGCREAVEHGKTGILCKKASSKSLYGAMKKFLSLSDKKKEQMGKLGRQKMEQEFDKKMVVKETVEAMGE